jgi:hypothetical protein
LAAAVASQVGRERLLQIVRDGDCVLLSVTGTTIELELPLQVSTVCIRRDFQGQRGTSAVWYDVTAEVIDPRGVLLSLRESLNEPVAPEALLNGTIGYADRAEPLPEASASEAGAGGSFGMTNIVGFCEAMKKL